VDLDEPVADNDPELARYPRIEERELEAGRAELAPADSTVERRTARTNRLSPFEGFAKGRAQVTDLRSVFFVMAGMRGDTMKWPQTAVVAPADLLDIMRRGGGSQ